MSRFDPMILLQKIELVEPGPKARLAIERSAGNRYISKDTLKKTDSICAWCEKVPVTDKRRKYCSEPCSESSTMNCYPQSPSTKMWLLINRQDCCCVGCGLSFRDSIVRRLRRHIRNHDPRHYPLLPITYFQVGFNTGSKHQVDHIVPIHKGGQGSGLDNVQVLCTSCHNRKSADERRRA